MRNISAPISVLLVFGASSALAVESAPAASAPEPKPAASAGGVVPTEEAARTYAAPGSADVVETAPGADSPAAPGGPASGSDGTSPPASARPASTASKAGSDAEDAEPKIVPARDTVGHHLAVGAIGGIAVPFGSIDSNVAQRDLLHEGLSLGGDITYGVSRTVMVGAYGEVAMPSGQGPWSGRNASAIAAGPMVRYHLVQGTSFDPWLSYGIGFRRVSSGTASLTGLDWARLQLGGDWYFASALGIGPVVQLSMGTVLDSTGSLASKAVDAELVLGVRLVFDGPGK